MLFTQLKLAKKAAASYAFCLTSAAADIGEYRMWLQSNCLMKIQDVMQK